LNETDTLTNQNIFNLKTIPPKTLIIGAGPIGLELGQALAMLGSEVTIATIDKEFAQLEDAAIRPLLKKHFDKLGITIHLQAFINRVKNNVAIFDHRVDEIITGEMKVPFDKVLIAIGRVPNIPQGLESAGIKFDNHCIMVDSQHRTSNKYVYAIGDVAQKLKFTHTADDIARQVVKRVASYGLFRVDKRKSVPKVTYTYPEVAQVGLSWSESIKKYKEDELMRIEVPFSENDRAKTDETTDGILIVIARRLNGTILGAHIIGPAAGELISIFTLAIEQRITLWKLQNIIYAYPTYSLIVKKAADQFVSRQLSSLESDVISLIKRSTPKFLAAVFWITLIYTFQHYRISHSYSYQDVLFQLLHFFTSTMWGPLVYMTLYAIRPLILFPATLLTALSGALFGFWWGILYTILGENASANFAYWIGRFFGKDLKLEDTIIGNWIEALRKNSFETVLLMRLFYVPFDLTNYGAGVVKADWKEYFFATLIGIMPGLTTFVALGAAVDLDEFQMNGLSFNAFDPKFLALSIVIFIVSLILSRMLKRWRADM
ncbi:FAD-dependent oxidoreductase, partial [Candidatus Kaiserbacteria bacterium]|nr:FAD-dependent oxidoreductase [Candidatus Kaiserbacteria bacterium]